MFKPCFGINIFEYHVNYHKVTVPFYVSVPFRGVGGINQMTNPDDPQMSSEQTVKWSIVRSWFENVANNFTKFFEIVQIHTKIKLLTKNPDISIYVVYLQETSSSK